ncbi:MAG: lipid A export permease/ATP-binding protein MsbA, partial [Duodenibacillus sp.]|nr:lipid A export permease/ATP-binding protein MsbA [Duodenibacillus sp.]
MKRPSHLVDPVLKRLFTYLLPYKWKMLLAALFLMGAASTSSLTAMLLGKLTDAGFYEQQAWTVVGAPLALLLVSLLFAVCTVMNAYIMAVVTQSVLVKLRAQMYEAIMHWPAVHYQDVNTGLISSKFVNEAAVALSGATESVIILVRDSTQVAALLAILFWHDWQLTLVTLIVIPALSLTLWAINKRVKRIVKDSQTTLGGMISRVQESYVAQRLVKITGAFAFEDARFAKVNERIRALELKTIKYESLATPFTQFLTMVAVAFVVSVALLQVQQG